MSGRPTKSKEQIAWERHDLAPRLKEMREQACPPSEGTQKSQQTFAELAGLTDGAYQKMEQRGALSAYAVMRICTAHGINPFDLLAIPQVGEAVSTAAVQIAMVADRLSEDDQKDLLAHARTYPMKAKTRHKGRKRTEHVA